MQHQLRNYETPNYNLKYRDQLQRSIELTGIPKRIVSLVPSQTELLVDLGLEYTLVGITKFCVHPKHLRHERMIVGGTKQVHFDKIIALNPDIILCNKEENTKEMIAELEQIAPVHISNVGNLKDALQLISMYGHLFSAVKNANHLIKEIDKVHRDFKSFVSEKPRLKVAYFIWKDPWMVAGNNTFINAMLGINNFKNTFRATSRYPKIKLDNLQKNPPEVLLLSSEPFPFKKKHIELLSSKFPKSKILLVDGEMFSWYGSRLLQSFKYFKELHQNHLS